MPDTKRLLQPEKIRLLDFRLLTGRLDSQLDFDPEKTSGYEFSVDFDMQFDLKLKGIKADFLISLKSQSELDREEAKAEYHLIFAYHVDNLLDLVRIQKDNTLEVDHQLANAISSITYSTARGILIARFQGTAFSDFYLPIVDPNTLFEKKNHGSNDSGRES